MNEQTQLPPIEVGHDVPHERYEMPFDQQVKEMAHRFDTEQHVPTEQYGQLAYLVSNMDRVDGPEGIEYHGPGELGTIPSDQAEVILRVAEVAQEAERPGKRPFSKLLAAGHIQAEGENSWLPEMYDELAGGDSSTESWGTDSTDKALYDAYREQRLQRLAWGVPASEDEAEEMVGNAVVEKGFKSDAVRDALLDANEVVSPEQYSEMVLRGQAEAEAAWGHQSKHTSASERSKREAQEAEQHIADAIAEHGLYSDEVSKALYEVGDKLDPMLYHDLVTNGEAMVGEDYGRHARHGRHAGGVDAPAPSVAEEAAGIHESVDLEPEFSEKEVAEQRIKDVLAGYGPDSEEYQSTASALGGLIGSERLEELRQGSLRTGAVEAQASPASEREEVDRAVADILSRFGTGSSAEEALREPDNGIEGLTEGDLSMRTEIGSVTVSGVSARGERGSRPDWPEKATEIKEGILHLRREGAENLLAHTDIRGDGKAGRLTRELIGQSDLMPRYTMKAGERYFAFSQAYDLGNGRIAVLGFVQDDETKGLVARSYYRSDTHSEWRYLPQYRLKDGEISWFSKGYGEESLKLPAELQAGLAATLEDQDELVHLDTDTTRTVFSGTARTVGSGETVYHRQVGRYPRAIGVPEMGANGELPPPEQVDVSDEDQPDFERQISKWEQATELYGRVRSFTYRSRNGSLLYTFNVTEDGRAGVGGIENNSPLESTGLHRVWLTGGALTTPIAERPSQAGGYGGDPEPRNNRRVDMFNNYLWRVPMIQRFLRGNPDGAARPQRPQQPPALRRRIRVTG